MSKVEAISELFRRRIRQSIKTRLPFKSVGWGVYDSDIYNYQREFQSVLGGLDIISWVQSKDTLTVIDLMSSSAAIASVFEHISPDKPRFGLAVSLEDVRSDLQKERDGMLNIEKLNLDIVAPSTWRKIRGRLEGRRADLIMERAMGGVDTLPRDFGFYKFTISRMWEMLNENGILLLQTPNFGYWNAFKISRLVKSLIKKNVNVVFDSYRGVIKFVKTPDSPEKLPF